MRNHQLTRDQQITWLQFLNHIAGNISQHHQWGFLANQTDQFHRIIIHHIILLTSTDKESILPRLYKPRVRERHNLWLPARYYTPHQTRHNMLALITNTAQSTDTAQCPFMHQVCRLIGRHGHSLHSLVQVLLQIGLTWYISKQTHARVCTRITVERMYASFVLT